MWFLRAQQQQVRFSNRSMGIRYIFRIVYPESWVWRWDLWPSSAAWGSGTLSRLVADSGAQRLDWDAPPSPPSPWSEGCYSLLKITQSQHRYSTKSQENNKKNIPLIQNIHPIVLISFCWSHGLTLVGFFLCENTPDDNGETRKEEVESSEERDSEWWIMMDDGVC